VEVLMERLEKIKPQYDAASIDFIRKKFNQPLSVAD
jgi:hypothetical protein